MKCPKRKLKPDHLLHKLTADKCLSGKATPNQMEAMERWTRKMEVNEFNLMMAEIDRMNPDELRDFKNRMIEHEVMFGGKDRGLVKQLEKSNTINYSSLGKQDTLKALDELHNVIPLVPKEPIFYTSHEGNDRIDASYKNDKVRLAKYAALDKERLDKDRAALLNLIGQAHYDIFERVCKRFNFDRTKDVYYSNPTYTIYTHIRVWDEAMDTSESVSLVYSEGLYSLHYQTESDGYRGYCYLYKDVSPEQIESILDEVQSKIKDGYIKLT